MERLITSDPAIASGHPVIAGTRIPVWLVVGMFRGGYSPAEIVDSFDRLTLEVVYYVLATTGDRSVTELGGPAD
jgi:uncharacterized protein (DUF433 family)